MAFISILGRATEGDADRYFLTLDTDKNTWVGGEPGGASKVLASQSGTFLYKSIPDAGTYCLDGANKVVIFLRAFSVGQARPGQSGIGNANERGRTVNWNVDSL
jgi:hypothetical protein